jgi:hypothetical protein
MDLRAQAAAAAPDRLVTAFLTAPALCRCARTIVLARKFEPAAL